MTQDTKWDVRFTKGATKQFDRLNPAIRRQINRYIFERLATDKDPKRFGKPLTGEMRGLWRYRIGDYRLICEIKNATLVILVAHVAHRREVYD
jgi:mRNA interferase RelE/StbE